MKNILFTIIITFLITACAATSTKINNVSLGMSKSDVIKAMGEPTSVSARNNTEYLRYELFESGYAAFKQWGTTYFVKLVNGKVSSYGKLGDFDSTKTPETKSKIDLNINKP